MKLKAKKKFNFYRNTCNLYLRKSFSNIFLTMTDKKGNVVKCASAGSSGMGRSKRRKKAPQSIEKIMLSLKFYFNLYKIENVFLYFSARTSKIFYTLLKEIQYHGFNIRRIF